MISSTARFALDRRRAQALEPRPMAEPQTPQVEPATTLGPVRMIFAAAARYPGKVALARVALVVTAPAPFALPPGFRLTIDRGFATGADPAEIGRWFRYLFAIVVVLALG